MDSETEDAFHTLKQLRDLLGCDGSRLEQLAPAVLALKEDKARLGFSDTQNRETFIAQQAKLVADQGKRIAELERELNRATQGRWGEWELEVAKARGHATCARMDADQLREALRTIRDSYGKHVSEHMPDDGGDAQPQPECFCPFCISTRALKK